MLNAGTRSLSLYLQNAGGEFLVPAQLPLGGLPSDLLLADLDADGDVDILLTDGASAIVTALLNQGGGDFPGQGLRFRGGPGPFGLGEVRGSTDVVSHGRTAEPIFADLNGDGVGDVVVIHPELNAFSVLPGDGRGGFLEPRTFRTDGRPLAVTAADFEDDGDQDLTVLQDNHQLTVFANDASGDFHPLSTAAASNAPAGLSAHDLTRPESGTPDGLPDVLVGNEFGDILILAAEATGALHPFTRVNPDIALAVADFDGDGVDDIVFANRGGDRVVVQDGATNQRTILQPPSGGFLAPSGVEVGDLNADGWLDLVVVNSGANSVVVYLNAGGTGLDALPSFFTGSNPAEVTIVDVNLDGVPDLVAANEGSNDVSILLGRGQGAAWTLTPGPRLDAGVGPTSVVVQDANQDSLPDILVSSNQSDGVVQFNGLGGGFFNDLAPLLLPGLRGSFLSLPGSGLLVVDSLAGSITLLPNLAQPFNQVFLATGGVGPTAAVAEDFNRDGFLDLAIAHNGDGLLALLLGQADGFESFTIDTGLHLTDLALGDLPGGRAAFFATSEGIERIDVFVFGFPGLPPPPPGPPNPGDTSVAASSSLAQLAIVVASTAVGAAGPTPTPAVREPETTNFLVIGSSLPATSSPNVPDTGGPDAYDVYFSWPKAWAEWEAALEGVVRAVSDALREWQSLAQTGGDDWEKLVQTAGQSLKRSAAVADSLLDALAWGDYELPRVETPQVIDRIVEALTQGGKAAASLLRMEKSPIRPAVGEPVAPVAPQLPRPRPPEDEPPEDPDLGPMLPDDADDARFPPCDEERHEWEAEPALPAASTGPALPLTALLLAAALRQPSAAPPASRPRRSARDFRSWNPLH